MRRIPSASLRHRRHALSVNARDARVWALASANIKPIRTPTVVIEASLNCRITKETTQAIPAMSQAHQ